MKYVAFLDILGFKNKLGKLSQYEAADFISNFSTTAFRQWESENVAKLNGYIVSDSFIIYSRDTSTESLNELIRVVTNICKKEFAHNSILLRGAIAKGPFEKIEAKEISTLQKGLIVGQAYVDAYLLEGTVKSTGIVLSPEVYEDLLNIGGYSDNVVSETIDKTEHYLLRYLTIDFFLEQENLKYFVELAAESKWLPHYYNTLYFSLKREKNEKKVNQLFINLLDLISNGHPNENWRNIDLFIKNAFNCDVVNEFQTRFLKYIRQKLF
jgi:hypothetical protein